jgi:hypothetical protein
MIKVGPAYDLVMECDCCGSLFHTNSTDDGLLYNHYIDRGSPALVALKLQGHLTIQEERACFCKGCRGSVLAALFIRFLRLFHLDTKLINILD